MARTRKGELSASMAVLGLVIDQPDTVAGIGIRLAETFPYSRWSPNAAHGNLPSLERQGYVRLVREGIRPSLNRYEATVKGQARHRRWIGETVVPLVLRDPLQAKLSFVELEDLGALIARVREAEDACLVEYGAAHRRALKERRPRERAGGDLRAKLKAIQLSDEAELWGLLASRARRLGDDLQELQSEAAASRPVAEKRSA